MSPKDIKSLFEFYLGNLQDIVKNKTEPSAKTLGMFKEIEDKLDQKVSNDLFKWVMGGLGGVILIVGLAIVGANYRLLNDYYNLYKDNFVTKAEYLSGIKEVKEEVAALRNEFEFTSSE